MKSRNLIFSITIFLLLVFHSCKKEVYSNETGLLISSNINYQRSISGNEYSMMKLILNYGTVTPYKKLLGNWYIKEQSQVIIKKDDC